MLFIDAYTRKEERFILLDKITTFCLQIVYKSIAIDSFYGEKTASEEKTQEQEPVEEQLAATEQSPMTEMQDGDIVISLDDDIELHIADPKPVSQPVVTPRVDESKRGLSNIAGWMRGRRS